MAYRFRRAAGSCVVCAVACQKFGYSGRDDGLISGNGRIEAVEIDVAAKSAGRVKDIARSMPQFVFLPLIGSFLFILSLARFRKTIGTMA